MGNEQSAAVAKASMGHRRSDPQTTPHRDLKPKLSDGPANRPFVNVEWTRNGAETRSFRVAADSHRRSSQCTTSTSTPFEEDENVIEEVNYSISARSLSSNEAYRRPSHNSLSAQSQASRTSSRSPTQSLSVPRRASRRMSVDDLGHRRRQERLSSVCVPNHATYAAKFSLAGFANMNGDELQRYDSRQRISRAARDFAETGDFGLSLQEHLKLSSYQTLMLTQSWPRIKNAVFNTVFRELSQRCPKVKELFQKTSIVGGFSANKCYDIKEHAKQLVDLYDLCVQDLNAPCKVSQDRLMSIGEQHFAICGPGASTIWDDLGVVLTEAISRAEAVRGKREAFKAYISLTSFMVDSMKAGYIQQAKRKSLSYSTNGFNKG